jgi:hypothetical protein
MYIGACVDAQAQFTFDRYASHRFDCSHVSAQLQLRTPQLLPKPACDRFASIGCANPVVVAAGRVSYFEQY